MKVAVVKYNAGNIRSVDYALKRLGVEAVITADKEILQSADKVIFPGVGEAGTTMNHLKATGLDELIKISGNALLVYALKFGVDGVAIPTLLSRMYAAVAAFVADCID